MIIDHPAGLVNKVLDEIIRAYGDVDADETFGTEGSEGDVPTDRSECGAGVDLLLCHITRSLLADALGKDACLGHVEVKSGILLEDVLEISQDLK